jgi:hypothetical protein
VDESKQGLREPGTSLVQRSLVRVYSPGTLLDAAIMVSLGSAFNAFATVLPNRLPLNTSSHAPSWFGFGCRTSAAAASLL